MIDILRWLTWIAMTCVAGYLALYYLRPQIAASLRELAIVYLHNIYVVIAVAVIAGAIVGDYWRGAIDHPTKIALEKANKDKLALADANKTLNGRIISLSGQIDTLTVANQKLTDQISLLRSASPKSPAQPVKRRLFRPLRRLMADPFDGG